MFATLQEQQHGGHKTLDEVFGGKTKGLLGLATDRLCSAARSTAARMPSGCDQNAWWQDKKAGKLQHDERCYDRFDLDCYGL